MTACADLAADASAGAAPALRAVDCLANEATGAAFGRLFGTNGALLPALTIVLTLYIAFFAVSLLTGRSRIGISALTPRMMTLGLVLTFATSWAAYQGVVWNLAVGAPDQIAGVLMGVNGSATTLFADRIDLIFTAIADAAQPGGNVQQGAASAAQSGSFTPGNLTWLSALILLLGTVGVLVTSRIALAVLLALGPVFVVFALFSGTRGMTAGWLRGVILTAVTPLFVVVGGGLVMELLVPVVANLSAEAGGIDGRSALALFLVASVHLALMIMVMKVAGTLVSGWNVFGLSQPVAALGSTSVSSTTVGGATQASTLSIESPMPAASRSRAANIAPAVVVMSDAAPVSMQGAVASRSLRPLGASGSAESVPSLPSMRGSPQRARGVGSRFRAANPRQSGMMR